MNLARFCQLSGICLVILLCSSHLTSPTLASSLRNLKNSLESTVSASGLFGPVRLIKQHIADAFLKIGHSPNDTILHSVYPEAAQMLSVKVLQMERCYLSSVKGGVKLDIFREPLAVLVYRYLKAYSLTEEGSGSDWLAHLKRRVVNLVANIKEVARHVIDCLKHIDQPGYEPTKLALNRFSSLSLPEFFHLRHPKPLPVSSPPMGNALWKGSHSISIGGGDEASQPSSPSAGLPSTVVGDFEATELKISQASGHQGEEANNILAHSQASPSFSGGFGGPTINIMYDTFEVEDIADRQLPASFDYRDLGVVSVVKNQGGAQTCYLFAAIGAAESAFMLAQPSQRRNVSFSEKDAYNCLAKLGYNDAPEVGGQVETVYRMFLESHGIVYEKDAEEYDFTRKDYETPPKLHKEKCLPLARSQEAARVRAFAKEYGLEGEGALQRLKKMVYKYGPVTTVFRAPMDSRWLQLAGEMNFACNTTAAPMPDHAMLITGWTPTHLVIKNSYGNYEHDDDRWGVKGYLYLNNRYVENCAVLGNVSQLLVPALEE